MIDTASEEPYNSLYIKASVLVRTREEVLVMFVLVFIVIILLVMPIVGGIEWILLFFMPPDEAIDLAVAITMVIYVAFFGAVAFKIYND